MTEKSQFKELSKKSLGLLAQGALLVSSFRYKEEYFDIVKKGIKTSVDNIKQADKLEDKITVFQNKNRDLAIPPTEKKQWFVEKALNLKSEADAIFFGHGKNTKDTLAALFPDYAKTIKKKGIFDSEKKDELAFGETQDVMVCQDANGNRKLFFVPFRLGISQTELNKVNARVTGLMEMTDAPNQWQSQPQPSSHHTMSSSTITVTSAPTVTSATPTASTSSTSVTPPQSTRTESSLTDSTDKDSDIQAQPSSKQWQTIKESYKSKPQSFKEKLEKIKKENLEKIKEDSEESETLGSEGPQSGF